MIKTLIYNPFVFIFALLPFANIHATLLPNTAQPLYRHLMEVNQQWSWASAYIDHDLAMQAINFDNDIERIRTHLLIVEQLLRKHPLGKPNAAQLKHRKQCLDILHNYAIAGNFPQNNYLDSRMPYFMDDRQVTCAVAYLMQKTGFERKVQQIASENNYAYLCALMDDVEVQKWATDFGFTADELALIQPSYAPISQYLLYPDGNGSNGTIYAMYAAPDNTLLIGGSFSTTDGIVCHNIICRTSFGFVPLGSGVNGTVRSIVVWGGDIYVGGSFSNGTTVSNLARWNGTNWIYTNVADNSTILALAVHGGSLYAAGSFGVQKYNTTWTAVGGAFNAAVNTLYTHNGFLLAGGNFTQIANVNVSYIAMLNNNIWQNVGNGLNAPVHALKTLNGALYAGGNFFNNAQVGFGLAVLNNSNNQWQSLINASNYASNTNKGAIYTLQASGNRLFIGGDFALLNNSGNHLTYYDTLNPNADNLPPLVVFYSDSDVVHSAAIWGEYLYAGGSLSETWTYDGDIAHVQNMLRTNTVAVEVPIYLNLQGAFDYVVGQMRNFLRQYNLLPLTQPFSGTPWGYEGNEAVSSYNQIPSNVVDWVLVEARNANNVNEVIDSRAAWLLTDGRVNDIGGGNSVRFYNLVRGNSYVFSVRHRNHLAVMRSVENIVPTPYMVSFAEPSLIEGGSSQLVALSNGAYGLCAGDFNADGIITVADYNCFSNQLSQMNQYLSCDADLNRSVTTTDFNFYMPNTSRIGVNAIRY